MADGHIPKGARKKRINPLETQLESIHSRMEAAASYTSRLQIYEQAYERHSLLLSTMEKLLGDDRKTAALAFEESQRAANDMYDAKEILENTPYDYDGEHQIILQKSSPLPEARTTPSFEPKFGNVYIASSTIDKEPSELSTNLIDELCCKCYNYSDKTKQLLFERIRLGSPELKNPDLFNSFDHFIRKSAIPSDLLYIPWDQTLPGPNDGYMPRREQLFNQLRYAKTTRHDQLMVMVVNIVCMTSPYPLRSPDAHSWIAALALTATYCDGTDFATRILSALHVWCSQLQESDRDGVMLTYLFQVYYTKAVECSMQVGGDPLKVIAHHHAKKGLTGIAIAEYENLLKDYGFSILHEASSDPSKFTYVMQELARTWCVHGKCSPFRNFIARNTAHYIAKHFKKSDYNRVLVDQQFQRAIDQLEARIDDDPFFQSNLFVSRKLEKENDLKLYANQTMDLRYVAELPLNKPVIALRSGCGTGKSTAVRGLIRSFPEEEYSIVYVTYRLSLTYEVLQCLGDGWIAYNKIEGEIDLTEHKRLVIQIEALGRIKHDKRRKIILVLDEFNAIMRQMESGAGDRYATQASLTWLCKSSYRVLAMDGYLDQMRVAVLRRYTARHDDDDARRPFVIHNQYKNRGGHQVFFTSDMKKSIQFVIQRLECGERVHIPCFFRTVAMNIEAMLKEHFNGSKKVLIYHGDGQPWEHGNKVNETWSTADVVIHTSTIECGLSFEPDHFHWCVGFFSNGIDIIAEAVLQMMSRAREIKQFLLCFERAKQFSLDLPVDLEEIFDSMQPKEILDRNQEYFGFQTLHTAHEEHTIDNCCPLLLARATNSLILNMSRLHFSDMCRKMLESDGANCREMIFFEGGTSENVVVTTASIDINPETVHKHYVPTPLSLFTRMSQDELAIYNKPKFQHAFKNINDLRCEGPNCKDALKSLSEKQAKLTKAIQLCKTSRGLNLCDNSVAATEIAIGLRCGDKLLESNKLVIEMLDCVTGLQDPFENASLYETEIKAKLGCTPQPRNSDSDKKEQIAWVVSDLKKENFRRCLDQWTEIDPSSRLPYRPLKPKDVLTYETAITLLNHVLCYQFAVAVKRQGRTQRKVRGGKPDHLYSLASLDVFQEYHGIEPTIPVLSLWKTDRAVACDEQMLLIKSKYGKDIIAPGAAFNTAKRQKFDDGGNGGYGYRLLGESDIFCHSTPPCIDEDELRAIEELEKQSMDDAPCVNEECSAESLAIDEEARIKKIVDIESSIGPRVAYLKSKHPSESKRKRKWQPTADWGKLVSICSEQRYEDAKQRLPKTSIGLKKKLSKSQRIPRTEFTQQRVDEINKEREASTGKKCIWWESSNYTSSFDIAKSVGESFQEFHKTNSRQNASSRSSTDIAKF